MAFRISTSLLWRDLCGHQCGFNWTQKREASQWTKDRGIKSSSPREKCQALLSHRRKPWPSMYRKCSSKETCLPFACIITLVEASRLHPEYFDVSTKFCAEDGRLRIFQPPTRITTRCELQPTRSELAAAPPQYYSTGPNMAPAEATTTAKAEDKA